MSIWLLQCVTPPPCETWNLKDWAWTTVASVQPQLHWLQRTMGSEFTCTYFLWYNAVSCLLPFHIPGRYWWNSTWAKDWDWGFQTLLSEHLDLEFLYVRYFMTSPTCINTYLLEYLKACRCFASYEMVKMNTFQILASSPYFIFSVSQPYERLSFC